MTTLIIAAINFFSAFTQAATGFGYAIFAMFLMPLILPFAQCSVVSAAVIVVIGLQMTISLREHIRVKKLLWPMLGCLITLWPSLILIRHLDAHTAAKVMGVFLFLLAGYFLYSKKKQIAVRESPLAGLAFGLLTGVTTGMFNIVGPFLALYYYDCCESTLTFKANLEFSFLIAGLVSLCLNLAYTKDDLPLLGMIASSGLAAVAAGMIGMRVFYKVNKDTLKYIIVAVLPIMGLIQLLK